MLQRLAVDIAAAILAADLAKPVARNKRTGECFAPGLGPHSETETFSFVIGQLLSRHPETYLEARISVPYPSSPRRRCDVVLNTDLGALFLEGKLLRLKGDNGKPNDNMLMHILSPYEQHRSALSDCSKLQASGFVGEKAIVIIGYDYPDLPIEPAVKAFETLAGARIGPRAEAGFGPLCHPVHQCGRVLIWQVS